MLIWLDSGFRRTWWSHHSLLALWPFRSSLLVSWTPSSLSSSSIASPSPPLPFSPPSGLASVYARWCSLDSSSASMVSKLVSGYVLPLPMKHFLKPLQTLLLIGSQRLTPLRSCMLQHPRLCGLVRRECHSRRAINQCRQPRRSWLCWHHHNRSGDMARHRLWLQSCASLRVLVVDPQSDHLPDRTGRVRAQRNIQQPGNARR